jgi:hypothetical protein
MARVWPNRVVEGNNLEAQIGALRKAFGSERGLIRTVSGHGYQFTGEIRILSARPDEQITARVPGPTLTPTNLPERLTELIGRDAELDEILDLTASRPYPITNSSRSPPRLRSGSRSLRARHRRYLSQTRSARSRSCLYSTNVSM